MAVDIQNPSAVQKAIASTQTVETDKDDWRVKLTLAPDADYLYKAVPAGIMQPLADSDGLIFPYTPEIAIQYNANYENYDLTHSNYKGYFYTGSKVENIILTATFTATDVFEANYMLAALHFLRSCTKMFYGQDKNRGMPPPVVFLSGLGEFQFNNHPCAITMMNYNMPNDVDYIPCGKPPTAAQAAVQAPKSSNPKDRIASVLSETKTTPPKISPIYTKATYVPTKININFTMIPIQTRDQVSKEFSLEQYANGSLLTKGFW
jgi:hypothetical protein